MGSISDKLSYLEETKREIADAIVEKGQTVQDSDTFRSYADKIKEISGGGGSGSSMQRTVIWEGTVANVGDSGICSQSIEDLDFLLAYRIPAFKLAPFPSFFARLITWHPILIISAEYCSESFAPSFTITMLSAPSSHSLLQSFSVFTVS